MSDERCNHEMIKEFCSLCRPIPIIDADEFDEPSDGRWFTARYGGECQNCGTPFGTGDRIRSADHDGYAALECCGP